MKERSQKHNEQVLLAALYWERGNKSISAESGEVKRGQKNEASRQSSRHAPCRLDMYKTQHRACFLNTSAKFHRFVDKRRY